MEQSCWFVINVKEAHPQAFNLYISERIHTKLETSKQAIGDEQPATRDIASLVYSHQGNENFS
jgi:hypothetical protein